MPAPIAIAVVLQGFFSGLESHTTVGSGHIKFCFDRELVPTPPPSARVTNAP